MNKWEANACVRVIVSIVCGSVIGWERRRPDRPAGVRTMALVCLGSCVFTIDSMWAFIDGPMAWDASRVSAAIPSGVGFLGAATIWKGTGTSTSSGNDKKVAPEVHGLTTATSVWVSAAIGILVGGALYVPAIFTTLAAVVYLRFAPRMPKWEGDQPRAVASGSEITTSFSMPSLDALRQPLMRDMPMGSVMVAPAEQTPSRKATPVRESVGSRSVDADEPAAKRASLQL
jgi:uncharacterized membrane protein YhiD involved in acid resistance